MAEVIGKIEAKQGFGISHDVRIQKPNTEVYRILRLNRMIDFQALLLLPGSDILPE